MTVPKTLCSASLLPVITLAWGCALNPQFTTTPIDSIVVGDKAIAVIGDLQQTGSLARLVRRRENTSADQIRLLADLNARAGQLAALVVVGDLVYSGRSRRHWQHFDSLVTPIADSVPVLPAIGNHDYPCWFVELCRTDKLSRGMQARFPWLAPGEPYDVAADDVLMLFLDSESRLVEQSVWLRRQLETAARRFRAALVFYHRPALSNSIERTVQGNPEVERVILPVLRDAPLPTVAFNGHIHGFEHFLVGTANFVTTAGGGGPRVAMPSGSRADLYSGPQCVQPKGKTLRPFNYVLLHRKPEGLTVEVRGFCRGDESVRTLYSFEVSL